MTKGWLKLQEAEDAIGADRVLDLSHNGAFVVPSPFAFSDFLSALYSGTSEYSYRYTSDDVERFIASDYYHKFVSGKMNRKNYDGILIKSSDYWNCSNGDDPKVVIIDRDYRSVIVRLRPVDIFDMALNNPASLEVIFPMTTGILETSASMGNKSDTSAYRARCSVCGEYFEGMQGSYDAGKNQQYDMTVKMTPIVLSYMLADYQFTKSQDVVIRSSEMGIDMEAVGAYLNAVGLSDDSLGRVNAITGTFYEELKSDGWDSVDAFLGAITIEYFPKKHWERTKEFLTRRYGSDGCFMDEIERLIRIFGQYRSDDIDMFFNIIDQGIDLSLAESIIKQSIAAGE